VDQFIASTGIQRKRGVFGVLKRELCLRSAIVAMIGHPKAEGDAANVIFSAVGHNLRRIRAELRDFLRFILTALFAVISAQHSRALTRRSSRTATWFGRDRGGAGTFEPDETAIRTSELAAHPD